MSKIQIVVSYKAIVRLFLFLLILTICILYKHLQGKFSFQELKDIYALTDSTHYRNSTVNCSNWPTFANDYDCKIQLVGILRKRTELIFVLFYGRSPIEVYCW